jgi:hypothetical protein
MSNDKDLAVGAIGAFKEVNPSSSLVPGIPNGPPAKVVPSYLVKILPDIGSKKTYKMFIAISEPAFNSDFIHVKGFFTESGEDVIIVGYREMVAGATAAQIIEMWIPWHTIHSVRSLVFKTSKK